MIDVAEAEQDEGGLVETPEDKTPEDKPQRPRRTRRKAPTSSDTTQEQQTTPDAAE